MTDMSRPKFRGGAIIRTECALIALSEGPCGRPVGCSMAASNNRGTPCADCIVYPSTETFAGHFSENDHRQFRLIRSDPFLLISPQADRSLAPGRCLSPGVGIPYPTSGTGLQQICSCHGHLIGGVIMPCPHFSIGIVSRGSGGSSHSCTDSASYQSGEKIYSEYEGVWHSGKHTERIVHTDILLPPNAPKEYQNRSTLWNAVDTSEKSSVAQTARRIIVALPRELSLDENIALITSYCQEQFVDKGMIADIAVHHENDGNPHAHVLLTMRAMDENGKWLPKTKTSYQLDENGERIKDANGKPKRIRLDTVDWNSQGKAEVWRHAWEIKQNEFLEKTGCSERVDMRSYKRQGIEKIPQQHMGPAVTAMERKGVDTEIGNRNQEISSGNQSLDLLQRMIEMLKHILQSLMDLIRSISVIENPEEKNLVDLLNAYRDLRAQDLIQSNPEKQNLSEDAELTAFDDAMLLIADLDVTTVNDLALCINDVNRELVSLQNEIQSIDLRLQDINTILQADHTIRNAEPVFEKYCAIHFTAAREKYREQHGAEMDKAVKSKAVLKKLNVSVPVDRKALQNEAATLKEKLTVMSTELGGMKQKMIRLQNLRNCIRKVMPEALPARRADGKEFIHENMDAVTNQKNLDRMATRVTEQAIRHSEERGINAATKQKEEAQHVHDDQKKR